MKALARRIKMETLRLIRDERGAEGLEKLLILAAVVLPLLVVLVVFRNKITDWMKTSWNGAQSDAANMPDPNT